MAHDCRWLVAPLIALLGLACEKRGASPEELSQADATLTYEKLRLPVKTSLLFEVDSGVYYLFAASGDITCDDAPMLAAAWKDVSERTVDPGIHARVAIVSGGSTAGYRASRAHFARMRRGALGLSAGYALSTGATEGEVVAFARNGPVELNVRGNETALVGKLTPTRCKNPFVHPGTPNEQQQVAFRLDGKRIRVRDAKLEQHTDKGRLYSKLVLSSEPVGCQRDVISMFVPVGLAVEWSDKVEDHVALALSTIGEQGYTVQSDPANKVKKTGRRFELLANTTVDGRKLELSGTVEPTLCKN